MLILLSQLIGRPVIAFDEAEPIGVIRDPIINSENGKLHGYFFGHGFLHMKQDLLAADDIVGYDDARIVVQQPDVVRKIEDEPRIGEILKKKIPVLGAHVITESGKNLGRANDLLLDTQMNMIVRYYVHGMLQDRIIPAEHVIAIEKRGIIVNDMAPAAGAVAAEAEPTA
jgi:uncharacterized protein YrrD